MTQEMKNVDQGCYMVANAGVPKLITKNILVCVGVAVVNEKKKSGVLAHFDITNSSAGVDCIKQALKDMGLDEQDVSDSKVVMAKGLGAGFMSVNTAVAGIIASLLGGASAIAYGYELIGVPVLILGPAGFICQLASACNQARIRKKLLEVMRPVGGVEVKGVRKAYKAELSINLNAPEAITVGKCTGKEPGSPGNIKLPPRSISKYIAVL